MPQGSFAARVGAFASKTKERMTAVRNAAVEETVAVMQTPRGKGGNLRLKTGFLRASLMAAVGRANFTVRKHPGGAGPFPYDEGQITLILAQAQITDAVEVVYTAEYARPREYGARGQPGDRWVALAAQQWPQIVADKARELEARITSR